MSLHISQGPDQQPGRLLARGVCRALVAEGMAPLTEYVPAPGLRVDVIALGRKSEVWVVECKSSVADFRADTKWRGYLDWCDRFFWAVDTAFPVELLPDGTGLILADAYGGEIVRMAPEMPLHAARRRAVVLDMGRVSACRLQRLIDPDSDKP
jgi:hypothetical protein